MSSTGYLHHAHRILFKRNALPLYLVFFVTNRCQARCRHCLFGSGEIDTSDELTLDEIEKIARTMGPLLFLLLTGGDPFLRKDIPDIIGIFKEHTNVSNVGMPTNGLNHDTVVASVSTILERFPDIDYAVDISLDGLGEDHDYIRNVPGIFDKAIRTFHSLAELRKQYPRFNLNIAITVSAHNQYKLKELHDYIVNELKPNTINHLLVRGKPREIGSLELDIENYIELCRTLDDDLYSAALPGYISYPFADFVNAMKSLRNRIIADTWQQQCCQIPCTAGVLGANIFAKGELYPCELLDKPIGNLREVNYDFKALWHSDKATEIRKWIRESKCHCTYECFLTNNIMFNPRLLPSVLAEYTKIKYYRLRNRFHSK